MAYVILIATVITSLSAWYVFPHFMEEGMLRPYYMVREKRWYQLITSGFLHADFIHLFVNMLTFYFFGPFLEHELGTWPFTGLYFFALIVSGIPSAIRQKNNPDFATLGASGAVEGVIFSFILFHPLTPLYLFFIPIGIPAIIFGGLFLLYSLYAGYQQKGRINHTAHTAGALAGILFTVAIRPESVSIFFHQLGLFAR